VQTRRATRLRASRTLAVALAAATLTLAACDIPTALPRVESTFRFPVDSVVLPVAGVSASVTERSDLSDIDLSDRIRSAALRVTPVNAAGSTGELTLQISGGGVVVYGTVDVANAAGQEIPITRAEAQALLSGEVAITASGTLCRASGCGVFPPPFPTVTLRNELELIVELGGEGQ
jgi:hypothetical protein